MRVCSGSELPAYKGGNWDHVCLMRLQISFDLSAAQGSSPVRVAGSDKQILDHRELKSHSKVAGCHALHFTTLSLISDILIALNDTSIRRSCVKICTGSYKHHARPDLA